MSTVSVQLLSLSLYFFATCRDNSYSFKSMEINYNFTEMHAIPATHSNDTIHTTQTIRTLTMHTIPIIHTTHTTPTTHKIQTIHAIHTIHLPHPRRPPHHPVLATWSEDGGKHGELRIIFGTRMTRHGGMFKKYDCFQLFGLGPFQTFGIRHMDDL